MTGDTLEHTVIAKVGGNPIILQNWNDLSAGAPNFDGLQRRVRSDAHKRTEHGSIFESLVAVRTWSEDDVVVGQDSLDLNANPTWNAGDVKYDIVVKEGVGYVRGTRFENNIAGGLTTIQWDPAAMVFPCFIVVYAKPANAFTQHYSMAAGNTESAAVLTFHTETGQSGVIPSSSAIDAGAGNGWIPISLIYKHAHTSSWHVDDFRVDIRPVTAIKTDVAGNRDFLLTDKIIGGIHFEGVATGAQFDDGGPLGEYNTYAYHFENKIPSSNQISTDNYVLGLKTGDDSNSHFLKMYNGTDIISFLNGAIGSFTDGVDTTYVKPGRVELESHYIDGTGANLNFGGAGGTVFYHDGTDVRIAGSGVNTTRKVWFDDTGGKMFGMYGDSDVLHIVDSVGGIKASLTNLGSLWVKGNLSADGSMSVGTTLSVGGAGVIDSLGITNGLTVGTTLGVSGAATFGDNVTVAGDLKTNNNDLWLDEDDNLGVGNYSKIRRHVTEMLGMYEDDSKIRLFGNEHIRIDNTGIYYGSNFDIQTSAGNPVTKTRTFCGAILGSVSSVDPLDLDPYISGTGAEISTGVINNSGSPSSHPWGLIVPITIPEQLGNDGVDTFTNVTLYYKVVGVIAANAVDVYLVKQSGAVESVIWQQLNINVGAGNRSVVLGTNNNVTVDNSTHSIALLIKGSGASNINDQSAFLVEGVKTTYYIDSLI